MTTREDVHVLLVEDDSIDIESLHRTMRKQRMKNPVVVAHDGIEALEILRGENGRDRLPSPHVVLLDLNMPRMGGLEFLDELRADPSLKGTVVFVMSSSDDDGDVYRAYENHVAGYIVKKDGGRLFAGIVEMIERYCQIVQFPEESDR